NKLIQMELRGLGKFFPVFPLGSRSFQPVFDRLSLSSLSFASLSLSLSLYLSLYLSLSLYSRSLFLSCSLYLSLTLCFRKQADVVQTALKGLGQEAAKFHNILFELDAELSNQSRRSKVRELF